MKGFERLRRGRLDRVCNTDQASDHAVDDDKHHRFALVAAGIGCLHETGAVETEIGHQTGIAQRELAAGN